LHFTYFAWCLWQMMVTCVQTRGCSSASRCSPTTRKESFISALLKWTTINHFIIGTYRGGVAESRFSLVKWLPCRCLPSFPFRNKETKLCEKHFSAKTILIQNLHPLVLLRPRSSQSLAPNSVFPSHWQKCDDFGAWVCSAPASSLYQTKDVAFLHTLGFSMAIF
jgi:hypothetical protein